MTPSGMTVLLAVAPIDMRRLFDGLARAVQEHLGRNAKTERSMFLFVNRRRDLVKLLWRDATGWCLLAKRLDTHVVSLPKDIPPKATSITIDARTLAALLDGVIRPRQETSRDIAKQARLASIRAQISSTNTQPNHLGLRS